MSPTPQSKLSGPPNYLTDATCRIQATTDRIA